MHCSKCGRDNRGTAKFCDSCGAVLPKSSPRILAHASENAINFKVSSESVTPDSIQGERKTITALFADLKGSTELIRDLDPERAQALFDPALRIMVDSVQRYYGY